MADDHDAVLTESVFFIKKSPALRRPHTERSEEIGRDPKSFCTPPARPAGKIDWPRAGAINPSRELREDRVSCFSSQQVSFKVGQIHSPRLSHPCTPTLPTQPHCDMATDAAARRSSTLNTAVLAPMPSARVNTATSVKP